jgi:hypothetical protein
VVVEASVDLVVVVLEVEAQEGIIKIIPKFVA